MRRRAFITLLGGAATWPLPLSAQQGEQMPRREGATMALRYVAAVGLLAILVPAAPACAVSAKEKMETCKFGADDQKLVGAARKSFISKCMANADAPAKRAKTQQTK